jgi:8-oxo-dGTP pyrophosphatase MutT (NUDIX family)
MLSPEDIKARLRLAYQQGVIASMDGEAGDYVVGDLKCAAVLLPLAVVGVEWHLFFTRRTSLVEHHKQQVSFPGGRCDENETTPEQTALREAWEEIGIVPGDVHLLGRLNDVYTISQYRVTPVVGIIPWPYPLKCAPMEVERTFSIPLAWLLDKENWLETDFTPIGSQRRYQVITYRPYDGEVLWGATARMTHHFLATVGMMNT